MTNTPAHIAMKAALAVAIGKAASSVFFQIDGGGNLSLFSMEFSPSTVVGLSTGAAVIATAATKTMILERFQSMGWAETESRVLEPAAAAAFTCLSARYLIGPLDMRAIAELAATGAATSIAADYAHTTLMPLLEGASSGQVMAMR
jgi:hypothetical protein